MSALDHSLALTPVTEGRWRALADPAREANTGMFGGWTAALLANAALTDQAIVLVISTVYLYSLASYL